MNQLKIPMAQISCQDYDNAVSTVVRAVPKGQGFAMQVLLRGTSWADVDHISSGNTGDGFELTFSSKNQYKPFMDSTVGKALVDDFMRDTIYHLYATCYEMNESVTKFNERALPLFQADLVPIRDTIDGNAVELGWITDKYNGCAVFNYNNDSYEARKDALIVDPLAAIDNSCVLRYDGKLYPVYDMSLASGILTADTDLDFIPGFALDRNRYKDDDIKAICELPSLGSVISECRELIYEDMNTLNASSPFKEQS